MRRAIIAIARLGVASRAGQDEVSVVKEEVAQAVIVAVEDDAVMLGHDLDQGGEVGFVPTGRDVGVV